MNKREEKFKHSPKSLCQSCVNRDDDCFHISKNCSGNDQKLGVSYVTNCSGFKKEEAKK
jgi:hypothetical protein